MDAFTTTSGVTRAAYPSPDQTHEGPHARTTNGPYLRDEANDQLSSSSGFSAIIASVVSNRPLTLAAF